MKKLLTLALAVATAVCLFAIVANAEIVPVIIDDYDDAETYIKYYDKDGNEHVHDLDGISDDVVDELGAFNWFQGGHLYNASGHFALPGAYCVITFTGTGFEYQTQYRGPEGSYSSSAVIYIDDEEVATLGADILNGNNDTARTTLFSKLDLENKEHTVKIVNTATTEGFRLPFDLFTLYEEVDTSITEAPITEYVPVTKAPVVTEAPVTEAPATDAPTTEAPKEEKKGCGSVIGASSLILLAVLAAPAVILKKRK